MFDSFVSQCSSAIGFKEDMFRFMMAFLMEIPITLFLRYLPDNPRLKHMIYGCIGIFISFFIYNGMTFCVFITMLPVYFIMKYMPNKTGAYICFALSLGYLLTLHIKRMLDNYLGYDLDFSSVQMVLTIKFTTFAFSVANANDKDYVCSKYTEQHKIKTYPTLLEFFGYTFFYPAFFSGPALEFTEYIAFVDMSMFDEFGKKVPPISLKAVGNVVVTIFVIVMCYVLDGKLGLETTCEYYFFEHRNEVNCWSIIFLTWLYVSCAKLKYYFTWKLAELLSVTGGFGYSGMKDGETTWNRFVNVDIWKMETSDSVRQIVSNWNVQTERWLRYYVYERLGQSKYLHDYQGILTNMCSAFWHGLYPGYYIAFGTMTLQQKMQYMLHIQVLPLLTEKYGAKSVPVKLYHLFNYVYTPFGMMYCFVSFILLSFKATYTVYSSSYFIPHIFALVVYLGLKKFPIYHKKKAEKKIEEVTDTSKVEEKKEENRTGSPEVVQVTEDKKKD